MRKLTAAVFQSLDCVMQAPGGPDEDPTSNFKFGGWSQPLFAQNMGPFEALIASDYDLLLGKRTYDIFASYWPYNQDHPVGEKFERINKYVLTHSNEPLDWRNSYRLSGETADAVVELKRTDGRDLLIQGSSTLYPPLLSERLIDRERGRYIGIQRGRRRDLARPDPDPAFVTEVGQLIAVERLLEIAVDHCVD